MRSLTPSRLGLDDSNVLTIDERIQKGIKLPTNTMNFQKSDIGGNLISGLLDNSERPIDAKMISNEAEIMSLFMKASGQSQNVVPSFYEGGDDVYIENKQKTDVTVTDADRRAIHTISNYYNTLGIYRDDFDKSTNDKMARNAYYAICEKAMMDYMRSVQYTVKDTRDGENIESATDFFNEPNPQDDMGSIFAALIRDITRYDAGVLVKSYNKGGFVTEIKPYLATEFWREQDRVPFIVNVPIQNTVDLTGGGYASHQQPTYQGWWSHGYTERFWQRSRTGVYIPFQPEEICYFMMYPRTDGIYGTDFIKFLKYQIQYLIDSTKAAGKTFENGVVPSVVWEHPEVHTIPQLKQRIAELKYNNQGWQRFGSVIHTVNGEKVSSLAQSLHDMQWLEGQKFVASLVWATWGFSPEEFMGGGENRASSYVKRNITKSRLLYPLMTFLEQRINREVLPFLKGYRKYWKFSFVRDIELDDEQKVATTNSIKASTFLQYYQSGFPITASMELSGLDKNKYKFDIDVLEAEIMQNQLMMAGQQPGEQTAGGLEDQEAGRYGPGSEGYVDAGIGDTGQGSAQAGEDPSMDDDVGKACTPEQQRQDQEDKSKIEYEYWEPELTNPVVSVLGQVRKPLVKKSGDSDREKTVASNNESLNKLQHQDEETQKNLQGFASTVGTALAAAKIKKPEKQTLTKGNINPAGILGSLVAGYAGAKIAGYIKDRKDSAKKKSEEDAVEAGKQKQRERNAKTPTPLDSKGNPVTWQPKIGQPQVSPNEEKKQQIKPVEPKTVGKKIEHQSSLRGSGKVGTEYSAEGVHETPNTHHVWKSLKMDERDDRPDMDYDPYWLAQGISVEMEHTKDPEVAKEIAKDHLDEFNDYYQALKRMENGLRKAGYKFDHIEQRLDGAIIKAKVYITHPSEAPKGRAVRRGNKGGYYYITNEQHKGQKGNTQPKQAQSKKKSGGKGWETGGGEQDSAPTMPPTPPDIEGAEEQIKIEGLGIGIVLAVVNGHLVTKKLNNGPTNQFIKIVEKKSGETPNVEKIVQIMIATAKEMGLEIYS